MASFLACSQTLEFHFKFHSQPSGREGVIDCLRNWKVNRRWGTGAESASDDFLQRRGNDGGDQGEEEEEEQRRREVAVLMVFWDCLRMIGILYSW